MPPKVVASEGDGAGSAGQSRLPIGFFKPTVKSGGGSHAEQIVTMFEQHTVDATGQKYAPLSDWTDVRPPLARVPAPLSSAQRLVCICAQEARAASQEWKAAPATATSDISNHINRYSQVYIYLVNRNASNPGETSDNLGVLKSAAASEMAAGDSGGRRGGKRKKETWFMQACKVARQRLDGPPDPVEMDRT